MSEKSLEKKAKKAKKAQKAPEELEKLAVNVVRGLAMDAPHKAKSGHQGTAMALAPLAHVLWTRIMKYDAGEPDWFDRDRFILSAGHASILLYSFLYLTGYGLTLDDLKNFRQLGSLTPGHPEAGHTAGVEVTTGPLGQGFANGVGMAVGEKSVRERLGEEFCSHHIYALCSDGDLAEGVSHEAASIAGHLGLGRIVYIYDQNQISIDGTTDLWLSDEVVQRFTSYGWHVNDIEEEAENLDLLESAILEAKNEDSAPSLIVLKSHIAFPSPDVLDDPAAHGYALFDEEITNAKKVMGLPQDKNFYVPDEVLDFYRQAGRRGQKDRQEWEARNPDSKKESKEKNTDWTAGLPEYSDDQQIATRKASQECLKVLAESVPDILAGGADLTGNTGTSLDSEAFTKSSTKGNQIYFGVREHAMGSMMVGMAQHGKILPVGGTFLVFSDYMRPAIRLAALSKSQVAFVFTHDSVGVGEDGPTHQPVEHIASLRAVPGLRVIRPADARETTGAWQVFLNQPGPTCFILTRQNVPVLKDSSAEKTALGAYRIYSPVSDFQISGSPQLQILASGSEVQLGIEAAKLLVEEGAHAEVVSMPCLELFEEQSQKYQKSVLADVPRISIEAGSTLGWAKWAQANIGIDSFGASAPGDELMKHLNITASRICEQAKLLIKKQ